ncbi:MAG: divergent polysaccharide deacetylase family protein [Rhizobiales bacterium]|nr:divergent polysaccharide deacetylase family protein [Hyphomicrobiales bacterium]
MAANDLNNPFRSKARREARPRQPALAWAVIAGAAVVAIVGLLWVAVVDDPDGGRPVSVAMIEDAPVATGSLPAPRGGNGGGPAPDDSSPAAPDLPGLEQDLEIAALPTAPAVEALASAIPGLIEQSSFGPLPRVAPDGRRPRDAYARRSPAAEPHIPRIALVVGGMGISQTGTQSAIEMLPEDVTLAFAPYGGSLQRWVEKARAEGHEVLLQIPLEPIGYPEENPGEHTLLVSNDRRGAQNDLQWALSRMTSYAGVMNYMGARFTSEDQAVLPFLGEIGERGLYYLDDGSSPASRAAALGKVLEVPVVTADRIIDRDRSPGEIERELRALETTARSRGVAVGVASAFPGSIEAIAAWAEGAEARGIVLVPASAAIGR